MQRYRHSLAKSDWSNLIWVFTIGISITIFYTSTHSYGLMVKFRAFECLSIIGWLYHKYHFYMDRPKYIYNECNSCYILFAAIETLDQHHAEYPTQKQESCCSIISPFVMQSRRYQQNDFSHQNVSQFWKDPYCVNRHPIQHPIIEILPAYSSVS